jgi:hypothetical protein
MANLATPFPKFIALSFCLNLCSRALNNPANIFLQLYISVITLNNQKGGF